MQAISFVTDWVKWLLALIPVSAGAVVTYQAIRKSLATDEGTIHECNNKIKNTIKGAIIGLTISGLITLIKTFYS